MATEISVAFTGHRTIRPEHLEIVKNSLSASIAELYEKGYRYFFSGMAIGFDLLAAETIFEMRDICPEIKLFAAIPFIHQDRFYSPNDQRRYQAALVQADGAIVLTTRYDRNAYRIRNAYLVEHASFIIAYYDASLWPSGTGQTIRMAQKKDCPIGNLLPE